MSRIIDNRKKVRQSSVKRFFKNKDNSPTVIKKPALPKSSLTKKDLIPGKIGKIQFSLLKSELNVKEGQVIKRDDGLYIVDRIARGCSATKYATIYCSPFDPSANKDKILVPKKI